MIVLKDDNFPMNELEIVLQIFGLYTYTWRKAVAPQNAIFSFSLYLWSLFLNVFVLSTSYLPLFIILNFDQSSIGNAVLIISVLILTCSAILTELIMPLRSKILAKIFDLLKHFAVVKHPKATRLHIRKVLVFIGLLTMIICTGTVAHTLQSNQMLKFYEVLLLFIVSFLLVFRYSLVVALFIASISLISNHFVEAVTDALAESKDYLQSFDSNTVRKSYEEPDKRPTGPETPSLIIVKKALYPLYNLEEKILQVENLRETVVRYHFETVSLMIINLIVLIVAAGFAILSNNLLSGCSPILAICSALILLKLYSSGQNAINKAKEVSYQLKTYSSVTHIKEIKEQIYRLLHAMVPLQQFSICGGYNLDSASLVSCLGMVTTYLVIMMQVGWLSLHQVKGNNTNETSLDYVLNVAIFIFLFML